MSLLLGHSGVSILWRKTEVRLCGFLQLMHSMRDGDFEVQLQQSLEWILKGAIIQLSPGGTKQAESVDAKLNTWTGCSLPGPANIHTTD